VLPPIQVTNPKVHFVDKCPPFPQLATPPQPQFQSLNPISFWNRPSGADPTIEESYATAAGLLAEIRRTAERDGRYAKLIADFDGECGKLFGRFGSIQADRVDPTGRFCPSPVRREASQLDFPLLDPLPESISNGDILDFSVRSLSFGQPLYAGDLADAGQVWQTRPHTDANLAYFESAALTPSLAAMTYLQFGGSQRTLSFCRYTDRATPWVTHALPIRAPVESMAVDARFAYMLTADRLFRAPLSRDGGCESAPIPPTASGRIAVAFADGAVAAFHSSPQLLYVAQSLAVRPIPTQYRGVMCLAPIEDRLVCGVLGSGVVRLISNEGREIRAFVGHAAPVMRVARLSDHMFASSGDDATVRVWDVRDRAPVVSVATGGTVVANLAGSSEYLISALHTKAINVFDLRNAAGRPVLAIGTQDYEAAALQYNQHEDILAMFGIVEKEATRDSMMFVDNDGQNRQRIFRTYQGLLAGEGR
jgi:hypothetical protein